MLLRLQHTLDRDEGGEQETVDLTGIFTEFTISGLQAGSSHLQSGHRVSAGDDPGS